MSKWKCEICGLEFENFHAQGFNHKIYCPLCYYKQLYKRDKKEIDRLNNIINELEKYMIKEQARIVINNTDEDEFIYTDLLIKLKELKDSD